MNAETAQPADHAQQSSRKRKASTPVIDDGDDDGATGGEQTNEDEVEPGSRASKESLELFERVKKRRRQQLSALPFQELQIIEILLPNNDRPRDSDKDCLVDAILQYFTQQFYLSVDDRVDADNRHRALDIVRTMISSIDILWSRRSLSKSYPSKQPRQPQHGIGKSLRRIDQTQRNQIQPSSEAHESSTTSPSLQATSQPLSAADATTRDESRQSDSVVQTSQAPPKPTDQTAGSRLFPNSSKLSASAAAVSRTFGAGTPPPAPCADAPSAHPPQARRTLPVEQRSDPPAAAAASQVRPSVVDPPIPRTTTVPARAMNPPSDVARDTQGRSIRTRNGGQQLDGGTRIPRDTATRAPAAAPTERRTKPPVLARKELLAVLVFERDVPNSSNPNVSSQISGSLLRRPKCRVTYNSGTGTPPQSGSVVCDDDIAEMQRRLRVWDPFWKMVWSSAAVSSYQPETTTSYESRLRRCTSAILKCELTESQGQVAKDVAPVSALHFRVQLMDRSLVGSAGPDGKKISWGVARDPAKPFANGERRLLFRMLPLRRTAYETKKKADTHLWPKGTYLNVNGRPISLSQRRQQSHDHALWKGMCTSLDMTPLIANPSRENCMDLCTRDLMPFIADVSLCDYMSPDELYDHLTLQDNEDSIRVLSFEDARDVALQHLNDKMVVLDDSDPEEKEEAAGHNEVALTLSLLDHAYSMTAIETPVRGRACQHIQCFDLRAFLHANAKPSGNRWRCGLCEEFVSCADLVVCGLFQRMLRDHGRWVSSVRDKVQLKPDGTFQLMDENKLRYAHRKQGAPARGGNEADPASSTTSAFKQQEETTSSSSATRGAAQEAEIIDLDD